MTCCFKVLIRKQGTRAKPTTSQVTTAQSNTKRKKHPLNHWGNGQEGMVINRCWLQGAKQESTGKKSNMPSGSESGSKHASHAPNICCHWTISLPNHPVFPRKHFSVIGLKLWGENQPRVPRTGLFLRSTSLTL